MNKIKQFIKENYLAMLASFFIPALIMAGLYLSLDIYPGSQRTVLASDAFSQFSNFHASFHNMLHGKGNLFYSWSAGIGLNYYALIAYYLGGIFIPLVFFFSNAAMPTVLYFLTLLKIGAAGLTFYLYARNTFKIDQFLQIGLAIAYSLMSFTLAQSELIMWLDTFVYLPLVIWGIDRLLQFKKPILLFISYSLLFLTNYYFGFMVGIFSVLYFLARYFAHFGQYKKRLVPYLTTSLLAGATSMSVILPMYLDLKNNGETLTEIVRFKTEATSFWDLIMKNMIGSYDTTQYGSIPFIYIGILPLLLAVFYFVCRKINWKDKLSFGLVGIFLIASFYIEPLNLAWHGMHSPNMFLFRYSFVFSFLVIMLAGYGLEKLDKQQISTFTLVGIVLLVLFSVAMFTHKKGTYTYVESVNFYLTIAFMAAYILIFIYYQFSKISFKQISIILLLLMGIEASANGYYMLNGILDDWNYPSRDLYTKPRPAIESLVAQSQKLSGNTFYRMENLDPISTNDSLNFNYNGISFFSSTRNRNASKVLDQLGFRSRGTALNTRYANNTLLMDSLFGIRYNMTKVPIDKNGFTEVGTSGDYRLYENQYALGLGVKTTHKFERVNWIPNDNLACQRNLVSTLAGTDYDFYTFTRPKIVATNNTNVTTTSNSTTFNTTTPGASRVITYEVVIPKGKQAYLSLFPTNFGKIGTDNAQVSAKGLVGHSTQIGITGQYYNLGQYDKNTRLRFTLTITGDSEASFITPPVILLDLNAYHQAMKKLQANNVNFKTEGNKATATVNMTGNKTTIFTTIPYDKGWTLKIDGKKASIKSFRDGFITFDVPKGKHKIQLSFLPEGLIAGFIISALGIIGFIIFNRWYTKPQRKKSPHQR